MDIFKKYKGGITPTCLKEIIERRTGSLGKEIDKMSYSSLGKRSVAKIKDESIQNHFSSPEPYPEIVDAMPNRDDVRQLKMLTTGRNSELTAILTYFYQHFILQESYPELSRALRQIGIVEMTHYSLLSQAIVEFGGDPNLTNGQGDIWTARNVNTVKEVRKILLDNIKLEESAIDDYTKAAKNTKNSSLAKLYLRIAEDEILHIVILNRFLNSV